MGVGLLRRGRFARPMEPAASEYISSMKDDSVIFHPVVQINIAHTIMLAEQGIISGKEAAAILRALHELHRGGISKLDLRPELEDIHIAVEEFVTKKTGEEIGGKLHTAKSRNDQVATAIRLALRKKLLDLEERLLGLASTLLAQAEKNIDTIMPGYTHLQIAEPTTLSHHLSAYVTAFLRDIERVEHAYELTDTCPMGACAFAGTSFPIDREMVARLLGFKKVGENTMDAVGSRDFALQAMSAAAIAIDNLSRLAEEIILWSSAEFSLIDIPDEFSATSSIMPQKKNPVVAELARAKAAKVIGNLAGALTLVKALPQAYNLDLQELTPLLWNSIDETVSSLEVMAKLVASIKPKREEMLARAKRGFSVATELAANLVREAGISFREAHSVVGRMISMAIASNRTAGELTVEDLKRASHEVIGREITLNPEKLRKALDVENCLASRNVVGGPGPKAIRRQLTALKQRIQTHHKKLWTWRRAVTKAEERLLNEAEGRLR
ncbi:MAG: argininosuccinate lyase [Candidatus Hadarchaeum sp.]|uniref:argininosuccinate lyase n=1 Tax=Candidatus Hadarchaeum sp. TaxID=2883567 RepID=UPI003D0CA1FA